MEFPKINDIIDTKLAIELCRYFGFDYLMSRIEANPGQFKDWEFDGCSCVQEKMLGFLSGCDPQVIIEQCCLPHDLCYAYGEPGNDDERKSVDNRFFNDLVDKAGMKRWMAYALLAGVRVGGAEEFGLSFSWGFARKDGPKEQTGDSD